jgi:hypothetical protein
MCSSWPTLNGQYEGTYADECTTFEERNLENWNKQTHEVEVELFNPTTCVSTTAFLRTERR